MPLNKPMKSNDLGELLESSMKEALKVRNCLYWRLHTIRSWRGVSNPGDFLVFDKEYSALLECKATNDDSFSCASFTQLPHFEKSVQFVHKGHYGVVVYFHSDSPKYVYAGDHKVLENKKKRRPIRATVPDSYDLVSDDLFGLLDGIARL